VPSSRYGGSCSHLYNQGQNSSSFDIGARGPLLQSEDASEIYIDMNLLRRDETRAEEKLTKLLSNLFWFIQSKLYDCWSLALPGMGTLLMLPVQAVCIVFPPPEFLLNT